MNKIVALLFIIIVASLLGGIYGIIHDQITYTISNEYYSKFKFIQFELINLGLGNNIGTVELPEIELNNPRLGVTIVGALATWWVGSIIGIVLGLVGLIHKNGNQMFIITMKASLIAILIAFTFGIIGLLVGKFALINNTPNWNFPQNLVNKDNFIAVGSMHNFSYLGGLIGLIVSAIYSIKKRG